MPAFWNLLSRRKNRLAHRLVFLMVLASSLLSVVATCIQLYSSYQRESQKLVTETFDVIDRSFRASLENALWEFNFQQVDALLDGIHAKTSVSRIELDTVTDHGWSRSDTVTVDTPISREILLSRRETDRTTRPLGTLTIGLTLDDVRNRVWAQFWTLFFSNLGKTVLASLIMLALFHAMVTRHLREMASFVNDPDWLEGKAPLRLDRRLMDDDLQQIASAINTAKSRTIDNLTELQKANAKLTRSNRELDDFAYIASHDLREPLRAIHNHAGFLLEDHGDKIDDDGKKRLVRLVELSNRMERLIADLLYVSRLGRGHHSATAVDLTQTIRDFEANQGDYLIERSAKLSVNGPLPLVKANAAHIQTVFQNLIINGVKYNDAEEKQIEIGFSDDMKGEESGEFGTFYVRDNGIGIEQQFEQDVFRIFKRLKSEKAYGQGTGAGLTVVKKIVDHGGGKIWFTSTMGKGTTFYFTLPLADGSDATEHRRKAA
jgi:signal transduction histidine kinase